MSDAKNTKKTNSELHPFSGILLITVDNAFWGVNAAAVVATVGLATPFTTLFTCLIAFLFTGIGVFLVQKHMSEDDTGRALAKGFVLGTMAGLPTSIVGTVGGLSILGIAGFKKLRKE